MAQAYSKFNDQEYLVMLVELAAYTDKCHRLESSERWSVDWKKLERTINENGYYYSDLDEDGRFAKVVPRERAAIGEEIDNAGWKRCEDIIHKYGPNGSRLPRFMFQNKERPIRTIP